jgi:sarcosine oxidase
LSARGPALDAAVVGLGGLGAFALRALARRGLNVAGFDRLSPPHPFGSSHGRTRILREAYFEHPLYVPLVRQALQGWHALEEESGARLFRRTGALMVGPPSGTVIPGTLASARTHGVPHRLLDGAEAARAFPGLAPAPGDAVVHEGGAGVLHPEGAIEAALRSAEGHGARVLRDVEVTVGAGGRVVLPGGVEAERVVLALGPWLPAFLGHEASPLLVERQVSFWFELLGPVPPVGLHEYARGASSTGSPSPTIRTSREAVRGS